MFSVSETPSYQDGNLGILSAWLDAKKKMNPIPLNAMCLLWYYVPYEHMCYVWHSTQHWETRNPMFYNSEQFTSTSNDPENSIIL